MNVNAFISLSIKEKVKYLSSLLFLCGRVLLKAKTISKSLQPKFKKNRKEKKKEVLLVLTCAGLLELFELILISILRTSEHR